MQISKVLFILALILTPTGKFSINYTMVHLFHMLRIPMRYLGNFCQITAAMRLILI